MVKRRALTIEQYVKEREVVQSHDLAEFLGVSRQAAHAHLRALAAKGLVVAEGRGRASRYRFGTTGTGFSFSVKKLAEDKVWNEIQNCRELAGLRPDLLRALRYAVTEMINNVIDHSRASSVVIDLRQQKREVTIAIVDNGEGVFRHARRLLKLKSDLEALQLLSKGKVTTAPERHTGEGIFFSSKAVDRFEIESGELHWIVDNERKDMGVGALTPPRKGTLIRMKANTTRERDLNALFEEYSEDFVFVRTRAVVRLFSVGVEFVSRSEAKRLVSGLEKFREVLLDFQGVQMVGQGFADELFRVWQNAHPKIRVVPVNMIEPVAFMVARARAK